LQICNQCAAVVIARKSLGIEHFCPEFPALLERSAGRMRPDGIQSSGSTLRIDDQRAAGTAHTFEFTALLRGEQQEAMEAATAAEHGILVAPPGTGKTLIAFAAMARRGVSTLILVDRKALADQWRSRIGEFMDEKCGQ
jgi:superfamily II DNA or RNA helicase